jgi:NADP-dependent 3-hydroxy acid dehydrogenase YdfG
MTDLAGRVVAITGASSGIGEATALACARAGAAVAFSARRSDRIEALAERIEEEGGRALAVTADVGDEEQARTFVAAACERFGRLDALVNNAGVMLLGPIDGAPTEEWRRMVHVNVMGVLYCTHAALLRCVLGRALRPDLRALLAKHFLVMRCAGWACYIRGRGVRIESTDGLLRRSRRRRALLLLAI